MAEENSNVTSNPEEYQPTNNEEKPVEAMSRKDLIDAMMHDVVGDVKLSTDDGFHGITGTIKDILNDYHLSTDLSFIEKVAQIKFPKNGEKFDPDDIPRELNDAAFLPVNTLSDIALRQDIDMLISQIPEWATAVTLARDSICEADIATGKIARTIKFDNEKLEKDTDSEAYLHIMSKIEDVEKRLEFDAKLKHDIRDALEYGEGGYEYVVPYAKVFSDLYKYRINNKTDSGNNRLIDTSSSLMGYGSGFGESVEISLKDTIIQERVVENNKGKVETYTEQKLFTEAEILEIRPDYHRVKSFEEVGEKVSEENKKQTEEDKKFDAFVEQVSERIRFISGKDVALPVIEESAFDLEAAYETKYRETRENDVNKVTTFFESVMDENGHNGGDTMEVGITKQFENIKGVYIRSLPSTKMIPIRIDRTIVGYYYISDKTRPDQNGERKNTALTGYTLRSPSIGQDTFSPEQMFYEKLATKIINNFDLKFMRDNIALHKQIVTILEAHNFNETLLRFVFIPAEYVIGFAINKDGTGRGHSMLEPGLPVARMYMFLKLYSLLYQINNSQIRVINMRTSGIDKNIKQIAQATIRKFTDRRVTPNDIFNYRSSMPKISGCSELLMPVGPNGIAPIEITNIPSADAPISNDLLDLFKNEAINAQPVPANMVLGSMNEMDFAKEVEVGNTKLNTFVGSCKIDLNPDITRFYKRVLRWETDIDPIIIATMEYILKTPAIKHGNITSDMISNFKTIADTVIEVYLTKEERGKDDDSKTVMEVKKELLSEFVPDLDPVHIEEIIQRARDRSNKNILDENNDKKNIMADEAEEENMGY